MEIRNSLEGLNSLLGINSSPPAAAEARSQPAGTGALTGDQATLSSAASEMAHSAAGDGVRMDKVASIQAALEAGTYSVPASEVASKVVDSMLAGR